MSCGRSKLTPMNCYERMGSGRQYGSGTCSVKHHFPSPVVSWVEDLFPDTVVTQDIDPDSKMKGLNHMPGKHSSSNSAPDMHLSERLIAEFMELAKENTASNLETCGILGASLDNGTYYVTTLIVPKQETTAHSCQAFNEEEIHGVLAEQSLFPVGWIHTHPSQTCFLSSVDLHTQYSFQVMLPDAIAIVIAPTDPTRKHGIFRLRDPTGMAVLRCCHEAGFHSHQEAEDGGPLYETCSNVLFKPNVRLEIRDLRSTSSH